MIEHVRKEPAKRVTTNDHAGSENGWLVELFKDGAKTTAYLTAASAGAFKGYHLHRVRAARYVCVRGKMRIILYTMGAVAGGKTTWTRLTLVSASVASMAMPQVKSPAGSRSSVNWSSTYEAPAPRPKRT